MSQPAPTTLEGSTLADPSQTEEPLRFGWAIAPAVIGALTLFMFGDLLFSKLAVSHVSADLAMQFIPWREFGFAELRQGNIPLWNPYIYGGAPYFAGFQSALLYPPNWVHLFLPIGTAINWISALHVFLAGYFTYLWCRGRLIGIGGSILAGIMFMFCGPYFLHLYAGHLPHIAIMVWTPLMLLTLDQLARTGNWRWMLLGVIATTMEILAGHPQYVYFTGMILGIYLLMLLIDSKHRIRLIAGFGVMYVGGVLLSAMQFLPGLLVTREQVRSGGLEFVKAGTFSLPPQNLLTALVPNFFGYLPPAGESVAEGAYWGAAYLWEVSIFVSVTGLVLAIFAVVNVRPDLPLPLDPRTGMRSFLGMTNARRRRINILLGMIGITLVLAFGRHTPLYRVMYNYLPMYGSFRGTVKFAYLTSLFVAMLAGLGFDGLLRDRKVSLVHIFWIGFAALCTLLLGVVVASSADAGQDGGWATFVRRITMNADAGLESYFSLKRNPAELWTALSQQTLTNLSNAARYAAKMSFLAAGTLVLIGALFFASRFHKRIPYLLIALAAIEMFCFARSTRATMDPAIAMQVPAPWGNALIALPKDQRFFTHHNMMDRADIGMMFGMSNVAGYDPGVLKRYAELIYASQLQNPDLADQYLPLVAINVPVLRLLRCGIVLHESFSAPPPPNAVIKIPSPLPEALIVPTAVVLKSRDEILRFLSAPGFDPALAKQFDPQKTVVLENAPGVALTDSETLAGTVSIVSRTTDSLELQIQMQRPGILLVTNSYSTGWHVNPITSSGQANYKVVPANYALIGVPLQAGSHHFVLEYKPTAFVVGRIISIVSLLAFVVLCAVSLRSRRKINPPVQPAVA